ncbi:WD40 [Parelaphostrongylus tenuis]|uniref:WD40 n=1 Tax=Parelaphostrongylus tenuis TaxID=148309 RepID=A0AAD5N2I3_PARTN|nr:WD40 [Parelaphostrongylus tenuis]
MLLQTTAVDLMGRLAKLEAFSSSCSGHCNPTTSVVTHRTSTRSSSQSSHDVSKYASPSRNASSRTPRVFEKAEISLKEHRAVHTNEAYKPSMYNISVGRSPRGSPLRKWMSHQNVKGSNSVICEPNIQTNGRTTPSGLIRQYPSSNTIASLSRATSICSLYSSPRSHSNFGCMNRQPVFNYSSHLLQLQIAGRSVSVPVSESVDNFDPCAEETSTGFTTSSARVGLWWARFSLCTGHVQET